MSEIIQGFVNEVIHLEIAGNQVISGRLIDVEPEVIVLFNGADFVYVALDHVQKFKGKQKDDTEIEIPDNFPIMVNEQVIETTSLRETLLQAKDKFTEIYVCGSRSVHGVVTKVMKDYVVFESPVYKTMFLSLDHIKWLIPFKQDEEIFGEDTTSFLVKSANEQLQDTLKEQFESWTNRIVVVNTEGPKSQIGKVIAVEPRMIELQGVKNQSIYANLQHIKTVHLV